MDTIELHGIDFCFSFLRSRLHKPTRQQANLTAFYRAFLRFSRQISQTMQHRPPTPILLPIYYPLIVLSFDAI